jgi:hypothetical protein
MEKNFYLKASGVGLALAPIGASFTSVAIPTLVVTNSPYALWRFDGA